MAIVKEKYERIVVDEVDVCECDQCGKRLTIFDENGAAQYPDKWLIVRVVGIAEDMANSFCSWVCLSTYALPRAQGRIAVSV
jgi:hypothetical protein